MKRRSAPRRVALAVDPVLRTIAPATLLARVQAAWPAAAGERIAAVSEPVAERAGSVTVACEASVWVQELHLLSEPLLERLNAQLGQAAVGELRFRLR